MSVTISGSAYGLQWACQETDHPTGSAETRLKFYEYKYIRHILISLLEFQRKNSPNGIMDGHKESIPYFVYECDPKYIQMLIDKMTARMVEYEPYISKHTTAHTGYWEV